MEIPKSGLEMRMSNKSDTSAYEIIFEESMDISKVSDIRSQLIGALESGPSVILDGKQVERADTAALQVLSAFFLASGAQEKSIQWRDPSESLFRSAELLGLSKLLNLENDPH
jgi:anti-anti-sigma regulatory factor